LASISSSFEPWKTASIYRAIFARTLCPPRFPTEIRVVSTSYFLEDPDPRDFAVREALAAFKTLIQDA